MHPTDTLSAEFMGVISCKCPQRASVHPLRGEESLFVFGGGGCGVKFTSYIVKDND